MWFVASRVPLGEETYLAEQWFASNEPWFEAGKRDALWLSEDHPEGLRSHRIPHRGRWGFNEVVLNEAAKADPSDLLSEPYDRFAETLLRWLRGEQPLGLEATESGAETEVDYYDISSLEAEVENAERRGDVQGMAMGLKRLGMGLVVAGRSHEGIRKLDQASGIFLSCGSRLDYISSLGTLGWALLDVERYEEASQLLMKALELHAREMDNPKFKAVMLRRLSLANLRRGLHDEARRNVVEAYDILKSWDEEDLDVNILFLLGYSLAESGASQLAVEVLRKSARISRSRADSFYEDASIGFLINLSEAGENLDDVDQLRARLSELKLSAASQPAPEERSK
jgi:tetratricopeptide (TPR) repeat protein